MANPISSIIGKTARELAEREAKELVENAARELAEKQARELAEKHVREIVEKQAREIAEKQAREIAEKQARELAEKQAREIAEKQARELAEKQARETAEKQARKLAEKQAREAAEKQAGSAGRNYADSVSRSAHTGVRNHIYAVLDQAALRSHWTVAAPIRLLAGTVRLGPPLLGTSAFAFFSLHWATDGASTQAATRTFLNTLDGTADLIQDIAPGVAQYLREQAPNMVHVAAEIATIPFEATKIAVETSMDHYGKEASEEQINTITHAVRMNPLYAGLASQGISPPNPLEVVDIYQQAQKLPEEQRRAFMSEQLRTRMGVPEDKIDSVLEGAQQFQDMGRDAVAQAQAGMDLDSMGRPQLTQMFNRAASLADQHNLGMKFSAVAGVIGVATWVNEHLLGGMLDFAVDWLKRYYIDGVKEELVNQGVNFLGADDTQSHKPPPSTPEERRQPASPPVPAAPGG